MRFLVVAAGRRGGKPRAAQVGSDHRAIARKRRPHVAGLAMAVQQGSSAADAHIELSAVRCDLPRAECLGVSEGVCTRSLFHLPHYDVRDLGSKCGSFQNGHGWAIYEYAH
jgi:hypothetical protein